MWANGSDGKPPPAVLDDYHRILTQLHWQNAVVDTVSSVTRNSTGQRVWDGIQMAGPYSWGPPSYWFAGRYGPTRGANAGQGDNEHIAPLASLRRFIPPDKLWPINDTSPVFFVRCELRHATGALLGENTYWQSQRRDDVGNPRNDQAFELRQTSGPT